MLGFLRRVTQEKTDRAVAKTRGAWFGHISSLFAGGRLDDETWEELEELLVAADVGAATAQELLGRVRRLVRDERVEGPEGALGVLKREMTAALTVDAEDPLRTEADGPHVVLMIGVNGAGKTTSAAKLARLYLDQDKKVLLAAADTFRAAAIDQLQEWGRRLDLDVIAHQPGSDAGAVAFDAVEAAAARGVDVVIVDTAGRLHTKFNLMEEVKKVHRVVSRRVPERSQTIVLALDATTGQNGLIQAPGLHRGAQVRRRLSRQAGQLGQGWYRVRDRVRATYPRALHRHGRAAGRHSAVRPGDVCGVSLRSGRLRLTPELRFHVSFT